MASGLPFTAVAGPTTITNPLSALNPQNPPQQPTPQTAQRPADPSNLAYSGRAGQVTLPVRPAQPITPIRPANASLANLRANLAPVSGIGTANNQGVTTRPVTPPVIPQRVPRLDSSLFVNNRGVILFRRK